MKKVLFGIGICMFCLVMLAINVYAMPEPTIVNIGRWVLVESSEKGYEPYILDEHNLNTKICGLSDTAKDLKELKESNVKVSDHPSSLISSKTADKELVDGKAGYCYETKGETYIKLFDNSIIYKWENETWYVYDTDTYDKGGFYIEAWDGSGKILTPFIHWIEVAGTSKFFFNLTNYSFPIENLTLKVWNYDKGLQFTSGVIEQEYSCVYYPYKTECEPRLQLNINDMLTAEENNITSANVTETHYSESMRGINHCTWNSEGWNDFLDCMRTPEYFDIEIIGTINNTDPELDLVYLSTSPLGWHNRTEFTTLGARLHAPVLFMDFNTAPEGTYVKDGSVYNNYGIAYDKNLYNQSTVLQFGGTNEWAKSIGNVTNVSQNWTVSFWWKPSTIAGNEGVFTFGTGVGSGNSANGMLSRNGASLQFYPGTSWSTIATVEANKWYHVVIRHSDEENKIYPYVNNVSIASSYYVGGGLPTQFIFGNTWSGYSTASFSEINFWSIGIGVTDVKDLYNSGYGIRLDPSVNFPTSGISEGLNLTLLYHLNSTAGAVAYDDSANLNNATLYNMEDEDWMVNVDNIALYNASCGSSGVHDLGGCYQFDGVNDYISMTITQGGTINTTSLWYKNSTSTSWTHDVRLSNGTNYTNGISGNSPQYPIYKTGTTVSIGKTGASSYFNGSIDQVQIWDRALSAEEVLELYNGTTYNNSNHTGKYSRAGDFKSLVYYNDSSTYWNVTMSLADSISDVAIGGDITYADGYIIHTFTTNDTFTVIDGSVNFETLILAGGGGGGFGDSGNVVSYSGGGGGAGGMILYNFSSLSSGTYNVIVGTGGSGGIGSTTTASISGTNSSFNGQNAKGGGRGGEGSGSSYGAAGGSGGGQGGYSSSGGGGAGLTGQGNDGGDTGGSPAYASGGGGGKVSAGVNGAKYGGGGTGGTGLTINFNGTSVTYASGGYGGSSGSAINGTNGADGRGIGGGGGRTNSGLDDVNGGDGGDGIVIIRYLDPSPNSSVYDLCKVDNSCVSYWDLDSGNSDANPYNDEKGTNDGTPTGTNNATGISSGAIRFDGVDDYISIGNVPSLNFDVDDFAVSLWFKNPSNPAVLGGLFHKSNTGGNIGWELSLTSTSQIRFILMDSTANGVVTTTTYADNNWHNVFGQRRGDYFDLYVDGVFYGSDTGNDAFNLTNTVSANIGTRGPTTYFNGTIDEILAFNDSLSASEISQLYKAGLSQHANTNITLQTRTADSYNISDEGLVALWSFNNDNYTTVFDETGVNNGTRQGSIANATEGNGTVGKGYYFDGINDVIAVPSLNNSNTFYQHGVFPGGFTVTGWVKIPPTDTDAVILSDLGVGADELDGFVIGEGGFCTSNKLSLNVYDNAEPPISPCYESISDINDGKWHYFAVAYLITPGNEYVNIYIDGNHELVDAVASSTLPNNPSKTFSIGYAPLINYYLTGSLDELKVYNKSLTADEIQNLYELGSYHIEWNDWEDEGKVNDSNPDISSSSGNFFQIKPIFETDDTDVSAYLLNHSIEASYYVDDTFPPGIIVLSPTNTSYNYSSIYFNATANESIDTWIINYNGTNKTVTINTTSEVEDGVHHLFFYGNDSANNTGINDSIYFTVDTTPPAFDETPPNISILDNHEGNILNLNASDAIEFDCFSLNNSDFSIDCTGIITNTTALSAGNISLNVTINDTVNNTNSAVFNIEVNQSIIDENAPTWSNNKTNLTAYTLKGEEIYFNITLSDDNPDSFIFSWYNGSQWINDSAVAYSDSEEVEVVKTLNIAVGYINWTWYMNDTLGQSNQSDFWSIYLQPIPVVTIISPENTTYTVEQTELTFSVANTSELDVCWYNTGEANSTPIPLQNFTGLSSSEGENIWTVYCNNTENNIGEDTIVFSYNLPPSIDSTTLTPYIDYITASCSASDSDGIANYTLTINGTDETSGNISVCSYTFTSLTPGTYYQVIFEVYDNLDYRTETTDTATTLLTARRNVIPEGNIDMKNVYSIKEPYNITMRSPNGTLFTCRVNNTGSYICT